MNMLFARIFWLITSTISALLIMRAMSYLIKIKDRRWERGLMLVGCWLLDTVVIYIGDPVNILASLPFFGAVVLLACEGSLWKKVTVGAMYASTLFSFNALRDNFLRSAVDYFFTGLHPFKHHIYAEFRAEYSDPAAKYVISAFMAHTQYLQIFSAIASLLFAILLYIGIRRFAPDRDYSLSDSLWRLLFLLTATPFCIVLILVTLFDAYDIDTIFSLNGGLNYFLLLSITLLSFISLLWCVTVLARQQKLERRNLLSETNRKYYEAMEQQHFEIRRLKHDLANHMQILSALPADQRESYIRSLTDHPSLMQSLSYCGDATVNAVLSVKKAVMDRCGISSELSVDILTELPFDKIDVCALFANALDNAMEACLQLEESRRTIVLKCKARKGLFCLEIRNPIPPSNAVEDSGTQPKGHTLKISRIPSTTKPDKTNHGFGLKSMAEIVSRYHGNMELGTENDSFVLFLYIPLVSESGDSSH